MKATTILIGSLIAVALIALGVMLGGGGSSSDAAELERGLLFPDFDLNGAQSVEILHEGGGYRLELEDGTWGLVSKGGYPVDLGKLRSMLLAVSEAEIVDRKTADPALHARLGLQSEPEDGDLHWRKIEIAGTGGQVSAALILGKRAGNARSGQVFARRAGEDQTWLIALKSLSLPAADANWIDKQIVKIGRDRVRAARVTHLDGEVLTVSRQDAGDAHFVYNELGEDELRYVSAPDGLGSALEYLKLEDVSRTDAMELGETQPTQVSFWTWDGIRLDIDLFAVEDAHWARIEAVADPDGAPGAPAAGLEAAQEGDRIAEAEITPASRQADVDALNAKLGGWIYKLPAYNASSLTKRRADYIAPPEPPADEESDFLSPEQLESTPGPGDSNGVGDEAAQDGTDVAPQDDAASAEEVQPHDTEPTTSDEDSSDDPKTDSGETP